MPDKAFTYRELATASCEHTRRDTNCPACIRKIFLAEGRIDGLQAARQAIEQIPAWVRVT